MIKKEVFYKESNHINIDLKALTCNYAFIKTKIKSSTKIIAMVKSNAYGHGLIPVSKHLEKLNVDFFGVFTVSEALELRKAGIQSNILIFGPFLEHQLPEIKSNDFSLIVGSFEEVKILLRYQGKTPIKLHIKIDTGMGRIGFLPEDGLRVIQDLYNKKPSLILEGICTHFSDSSSPDKTYTNEQGNQFNLLLDKLESKKIKFPIIHASNSAGILGYPEFHYNCVRPGILLYGIDPYLDQFELKPILSLQSFVSSLKMIPKNSFVSYSRTFKTKNSTKIAIIPLGYADGFMWDLSNKAFVSILGKLFPIIGNICMNQFIVDVTTSDDIKVYDSVTLIEANNSSQIGLVNLARISKKIPYEILCRLSEGIIRNFHL